MQTRPIEWQRLLSQALPTQANRAQNGGAAVVAVCAQGAANLPAGAKVHRLVVPSGVAVPPNYLSYLFP